MGKGCGKGKSECKGDLGPFERGDVQGEGCECVCECVRESKGV